MQYEQPKPLGKCFVLDTPEQLAHGRSIADHARFNALGEPGTACDTASPPVAVDAILAGHISRFVMIRYFHPQ